MFIKCWVVVFFSAGFLQADDQVKARLRSLRPPLSHSQEVTQQMPVLPLSEVPQRRHVAQW